MQDARRRYVPAFGYDWALPLYDPMLRLFRIDPMRSKLVDGAELRAGQRLLDIGCGTGSLVVELKRRVPEAEVTGLDPDPKALTTARAKAARAHTAVRLDQGFSDRLPYADQSFDHVFSSFMFHHLEAHEKRATLPEVLRVLKPGGWFHLLDFRDDPHEHGLVMRLLHAAHTPRLRGELERDVEALLTQAGFSAPQVARDRVFFFGPVGLYRAQAPCE